MPDGTAPNLKIVAGRIRSRDEIANDSVRDLLDDVRFDIDEEMPRGIVIGTIRQDGSFQLELAGSIDPLELIGLLEITKHDLLAKHG